MRLLAPIALAAVLVACSAEAPTETPAPPVESEAPVDANALTANGWGPLRIGMTRAEVVAALGEDANPDAVGGPEPDVCDQFRPIQAPEDMLLMLENGVLTRISLVRNATLRSAVCQLALVALPLSVSVPDANEPVMPFWSVKSRKSSPDA